MDYRAYIHPSSRTYAQTAYGGPMLIRYTCRQCRRAYFPRWNPMRPCPRCFADPNANDLEVIGWYASVVLLLVGVIAACIYGWLYVSNNYAYLWQSN